MITSLPAGGAGGTTAGGDDIIFLGNTKSSEIQEVFDHLTFDGNIQRCVGMEAAPKTQQFVNHLCVLVRVGVYKCVCYLGDMLTSRIQGLRFSSSMMSKPNSSWQLYDVRTLIFSRV